MATERIVIQVESRGFKTVTRDIRNVQKASQTSVRILQQFRNLLVVVAAVNVIRRFTDLADSFTNLRNRLQATLGGFEEAIVAQGRLIQIARETRTGIDSTGDAFARLALGARDLGLSTSTLLAVTKTLNQAIVLSGATAQEARNAMVQLAQGIAAGALRGDELRSVLEQLPLVARIIADEFEVPLGQLRKLGEEGKLVTARLIKAFQRAAPEIDKAFGNTITTIDQALSVLGTNFTVFVDELFRASGIGTGLASAITGVASAFEFLAANTELVSGVFVTLGVLLGFVIIANFTSLVAILAKYTIGLGSAARVTAILTAVTGALSFVQKEWALTMLLAGKNVGILNVALIFTRTILAQIFALLLANPFVALAVVVAVAAGAFVVFSEDTESVADAVTRLGNKMDALEGKIDTIGGISEKVFTEVTNKLAVTRKELEATLRLAEEGPGIFERLGRALTFSSLAGAVDDIEVQIKLQDEIKRTMALELDAEIARRQGETNARVALEAREFLTKEQFEVIKELRQETALLALSEEDRAVALAKIDNEIPLDAVTRFSEAVEREARALFRAEAGQDALNKAQREAESLAKKLRREAKKLAEEQETFGEATIRIDKELAQLKPFLLKIVEDQGRAEKILADARKESLEAAREEIAPNFLAFKEENLTLTEQLGKVETDALVIKAEVLRLTMDESAAIAAQNEFIAVNTKELLDNSAARGLVDSVFTADASLRELEQAQKDLNEGVRLGDITAAQAAETMRFYRRELAGASNAAFEFKQSQEALSAAIRAGAVSLEEAEEISRRNRIELLESQRTLEAGAERSFLKFIEDATDAAAQTEKLMTDVFTNLEDALFDFVKTGKLSFNSLVQTIVDGLIKIGIQQAIAAAFSGGSGLFGGAGGFTGSGAAGGGAGGIGGLIAGGLFGAHNGAQFTVGANSAAASLPGIDNRLIAFKARDGEEVTVSPRNQGAGGNAPFTLIQNITARDVDSFKRSEGQLASRAAVTLRRATARR